MGAEVIPLNRGRVGELLDTGEIAYWTREQRADLGRCVRCEWHPETQGHHPDCPAPVIEQRRKA